MNVKTLEYCVDIARYKSFTAAAKKHYISQQALSQQIKALESELGIKIFERTSRSVGITPAGEAFLAEAEAALEHIDLGIKNALQKSEGFGGTLSIGCNGPTSRSNVSKIISRFAQKYPRVDIRVKHGKYNEILDDFVTRKAYDIIVIGDFKHLEGNDFNIIKCNTGDIVAVFGKDHPLAGRECVTTQELLKEQLISLSIGAEKLSTDRQERLIKMFGQMPEQIKLVEDNETMNLLVESGIGYMLLNGELKNTHYFDDFSFVPISNLHAQHPTYIVSYKNNENKFLPGFLEFAEEIID